MKIRGRTYLITGVLALVAASCGGGANTAADDTLPEPTTTEAAPTPTEAPDTTTSEATSTTMEHMDDSHMDDSSHDDGDESAVPDVTIEVTMTEFEFDPAGFEVSAGQTVEFVVKNDGLVEHEFRASNEHRIDEHIAAGHEDHDNEGGHHEGGDIILLVQPGETDELIITFPEDMMMYTQIACLIPGHYEAGMKADLTYTNG